MTARKTTGPITGKPFWIVQAVVDGRTLTAFGRTWAGAARRLATRMNGGNHHE